MKIIAVDYYTLSCGDDINVSALEALGEISFYGALSPEAFKEAAEESEIVLINKADITEDFLEHCKKVKYVGTFSTGYNNVDLHACAKRGITVCNVPAYSTRSVSQHVFALLLNFVENIAKYEKSVAEGDWIRSKTFCYMTWPNAELYGKTFGVYGYGSIGRATAEIAAAFGMKVIVYSRHIPADCPYEAVSREEIFKRSDYLSLHCPLTEETRCLVNGGTLSLMKPTAVLINTARGGLVDEAALAAALNEGKIAGACLDTLAVEPMRADNPLFGAKNCHITPHIGWIPRETRQRLVDIVAENLRCFLNGAPRNVVSLNAD